MIEGLMEKYGWYLLLVSIGLLFRCALLWHVIGDFTLIRQKIAREIGIVILITISLNEVFTNEHDIRTTAVVFILFIGYCFYVLAKKMPSCGYTESMLLIMNGYMVTALSFMSFPENLIFIALIIVVSYLIVKHWLNERKSDFWEIVLLCGESLLISGYMYFKNVTDAIEIVFIVLFVESFVYALNCILKYVIILLCGEETDGYWEKLMGLDGEY